MCKIIYKSKCKYKYKITTLYKHIQNDSNYKMIVTTNNIKYIIKNPDDCIQRYILENKQWENHFFTDWRAYKEI